MNHIQIENLKVNDNVLFQLAHWSSSNWHNVIIKYIGAKYIVMSNLDRKEEYCINFIDTVESREPKFQTKEKS